MDKETGFNPSKSENHAILQGYCSELGKKYRLALPEKLIDLLKDLDDTAHNRDARVIYQAAFEFFHLKRKKEDRGKVVLDNNDLKVLLAASILHDIGKAGPPGASSGQRKEIVRLYGPDLTYKNHVKTTVQEALRETAEKGTAGRGLYLPVRKTEIKNSLAELSEVGVLPDEPMIKFWRRHTQWSFESLARYLDQNNHLHRRLIKIASSHHLLEGDNPSKVDLNSLPASVEERKDVFLIKTLIVLDKYQGLRRRGRLNSEEALAAVKAKVEENGFGQDKDFSEILELVKEVEEKTGIFLLGTEIDAEIKK